MSFKGILYTFKLTLLIATLGFYKQGVAQCYVDKVYINAFAPEPNKVGTDSFDTDQNGVADGARDEFVQLCNDSSGSVDISGWTISDRLSNGTLNHSFGASTIIPANSCLTVINKWNGTGTMPSYFYDLNRNSSVWNNSGDSIYLSNGTDTCKLSYTSSKGNGCAVLVSGSNSTITTNDCTLSPSDLSGSPLPVELLYFKGTVDQDVVNLDWSTAYELNNNFFCIEKSIDGIFFKKIGEELGAGTSNHINTYHFRDKWNQSAPYYRLKQTDYDGSFSFSSVIKIRNAPKSSFNILQQKDKLIIETGEGEVTFLLTTMSGSIIEKSTVTGVVTIEKNRLDRGVYLLRVLSSYTSDTRVIVIP